MLLLVSTLMICNGITRSALLRVQEMLMGDFPITAEAGLPPLSRLADHAYVKYSSQSSFWLSFSFTHYGV